MSTAIPNPTAHLGEEDLELYALNRLHDDDQVARVEEHLLVCTHCQNRLEDWDLYLAALRPALGAKPKAENWAHRFFHWIARPTPQLRLAAAALCFALLIVGYTQWAAPVTIERLELSSWRSGPAETAAHSGSKLVLSLDLLDLPAADHYACEIVDSAGSIKWTGTAARKGERAVAEPDRRWRSGQYWVRLSAEGRLLREFGLVVR